MPHAGIRSLGTLREAPQGWNETSCQGLWETRIEGKVLRPKSRDVKDGLELLDKNPFILGDLVPVELLQRVDTLTGDFRHELILLFKVTAVHRLVVAFNLDGDGGLALLTHGNSLVIALNGSTVNKVRELESNIRDPGTRLTLCQF